MKLNEKTIEKLKKNPHYRPAPGQLIPESHEDREQEVRTFGVPPATHTVVPKHPTNPRTVTHKKKIDK